MKNFYFLLFDRFETLDAFGPAEIMGWFSDRYVLKYVSMEGGIIKSTQGIAVETQKLGKISGEDAILIPGGMGTRTLVADDAFLCRLKDAVSSVEYILTVCTGSALLAGTGLLDGKRATSNKRAFAWVVSQRPAVDWAAKARWTADGNIYTSSGVSAGMDMTLSFVCDRFGREEAHRAASAIEYLWNENAGNDPFAFANG